MFISPILLNFVEHYLTKALLMKANETFDLQSRLRYVGFEHIVLDGIYGKQTAGLLTEYAKQKGIGTTKAKRFLLEETKDAYLYLFIHCSATIEGVDLDGDWIKKLHMGRKGWSRTGYSDVIKLDGTIDNVWDYDADGNVEAYEYTWGVKGRTMLNRNSRHICYIGGLDKRKEAKDTRTPEQLDTMEAYVKTQIAMNPNIVVLGHNQVQYKGCPCFEVYDWCQEVGIDKHNVTKTKFNKIS